jgi:hypothetical protein
VGDDGWSEPTDSAILWQSPDGIEAVRPREKRNEMKAFREKEETRRTLSESRKDESIIMRHLRKLRMKQAHLRTTTHKCDD